MKKCPFCAEDIQDEAIFCRHCKTYLNQYQNNNQIKEEKSELQPQISNTTTIIKQVNTSPNYCLWSGGCCLLLVLSPILLPILGLGGMISFAILLYIAPLVVGLIIGYVIYWHTNIQNKKIISIVVVSISILITTAWILFVFLSQNTR